MRIKYFIEVFDEDSIGLLNISFFWVKTHNYIIACKTTITIHVDYRDKSLHRL